MSWECRDAVVRAVEGHLFSDPAPIGAVIALARALDERLDALAASREQTR